MNKIHKNSTVKAGTHWTHLDENFLALCGFLIRWANPFLDLKGYADNASEPSSPELHDCYLVIEPGTIWGVVCEKYDILSWDGDSWVLEDYKITQLNAMFQFNYFFASNIAIVTPDGMTATTVQDAIDQIAAVVFPDSSASI